MNDIEQQAGVGISKEVGRRLRDIRRARRMSLDDIERSSGGRWSASAIGAYERGFRNLSLPRLRELASFYDVPMSVLLGEHVPGGDSNERRAKLVFDLEALARVGDAQPILDYLRSIILERGDFNGRVLTIRHEDTRALAALMHLSDSELYAKLREWQVLIDDVDVTYERMSPGAAAAERSDRAT